MRLSNQSARRGMTLVELLLAMMGMAMVGAAVAAMMEAVSIGTSNRTDVRGLVVKEKVVSNRVGAAIRSSGMVLAEGDDYLVLWHGDLDHNEQPNLSEIQRLERDATSKELRSYQNASASPDTLYILSDDFNALTNAIKGTANFPKTLWASGVSAWDITLNDVTAQAASLVSYRMTFDGVKLSDTAAGVAALRNN